MRICLVSHVLNSVNSGIFPLFPGISSRLMGMRSKESTWFIIRSLFVLVPSVLLLTSLVHNITLRSITYCLLVVGFMNLSCYMTEAQLVWDLIIREHANRSLYFSPLPLLEKSLPSFWFSTHLVSCGCCLLSAQLHPWIGCIYFTLQILLIRLLSIAEFF